MLKTMSLALLASASFLSGITQSEAVEAGLSTGPAVIHAEPSAPPPVRVASAERGMGGGFIEFLFSEQPSQGGRYQQPAYQPSYEPRRTLLPLECTEGTSPM